MNSDYDYRKDFADVYKKVLYPDNIMPESFVNDSIAYLLKTESKEWLLK